MRVHRTLKSSLLKLIMLHGLFPVLDCNFLVGRDLSVWITVRPLLSGTEEVFNKY